MKGCAMDSKHGQQLRMFLEYLGELRREMDIWRRWVRFAWNIWNGGNHKVFEGKLMGANEIVHRAVSFLQLFL